MSHLLRAVGASDAVYPEFPEDVLYLGAARHIAEGSRFVGHPEPEAVRNWLGRAEAQRDECIARFDLALISGNASTVVAREILAGFLAWTRWSAREFTRTAARDDLATILRAQEQVLWDLMADSAAASAERDARTVDRFLQVWLTVLHEAIRTGNAPLYAAP
jgi:hypothetical protein